MSRILSSLAIVSLLLLFANLYLGLTGGDYNAASVELRKQQREIVELQSTAAPDVERLDQAKENLNTGLDQIADMKTQNRNHVLLGLLATLVTVMVNSIAVTYFIGTSRWCKEVCDTYALPAELVQRSNRQKRRTFPWAMVGIFTVLGMAALGAAADPGTFRESTSSWVGPHYFATIVGTFVIAWAFWSQVNGIRRNQDIINDILAEVHKIRSAKGLSVEFDPADQVNA